MLNLKMFDLKICLTADTLMYFQTLASLQFFLNFVELSTQWIKYPFKKRCAENSETKIGFMENPFLSFDWYTKFQLLRLFQAPRWFPLFPDLAISSYFLHLHVQQFPYAVHTNQIVQFCKSYEKMNHRSRQKYDN